MPSLQILTGLPDVQAEMNNQIAGTLGQGIGNFITHRNANKALEQVLSDPNLKDAPVSQKLDVLTRKLSPYGEVGQSILGARLGIEQQMIQEKQQKKDESLLAKFYKDPNSVVEKDFEGASPDLAKKLIEFKNKPPAGAITAQPISPQVATAINQVLNENKGKSAEELGMAFANAGVPPIYSNPYIETRRREDEAGAKSQASKAETRAKRDEKIVEAVDESRKVISIKKASIETMKNAILNNDLGYLSLDNLADNVPGFEWARSVGGATFKAAQKNHLISTIAQLTGRPNQWIEQQISDAYAKIGRPQDANLAALAVTEFESNAVDQWNQIVDKLDSTGKVPPGELGKMASKELEKWYSSEIPKLNSKIKAIADGKTRPEDLLVPEGKVVMYDPDGAPLFVDPSQVEYYKSKGAIQP